MTRMPKTVLQHRLRIQRMTDAEKKTYFKGKGKDLLKSMAWRHGYGQGSDEYAKHHDGATPDKNTHKINEEEALTELSKKIAAAYWKKAGDELQHADGSNMRKIKHRAKGMARAEKIMREGVPAGGQLPTPSPLKTQNRSKFKITTTTGKPTKMTYSSDDQTKTEGEVIHAGEKFLDKRMKDRALKGDKLEAKKEKEGKVLPFNKEEIVVNELSARKLSHYVDAAYDETRKRGAHQYYHAHEARANKAKIQKREKGMKLALRKIAREEVMNELASDNPSNWGGWQGGFPGGNGSALKGLKKGKNDDTGKKPPKAPPADKKEQDLGKDIIKLSKEKTQVIVSPTIQQSQNKIDVKDVNLSKPDNPVSPGKPVKQVREMTENKAKKILKMVRKGKEVNPKKLAKAMNKTAKGSRPSWIRSDKRLGEGLVADVSYTKGPMGAQQVAKKQYKFPEAAKEKAAPNFLKTSIRNHPEHQDMVRQGWKTAKMSGQNMDEAQSKDLGKGVDHKGMADWWKKSKKDFDKLSKKPLVTSGSTMTGGEEVVHETIERAIVHGIARLFGAGRKKKLPPGKVRANPATTAKKVEGPTRAQPHEGPWGKRGGGATGPQVSQKPRPKSKAEIDAETHRQWNADFAARWKKRKEDQAKARAVHAQFKEKPGYTDTSKMGPKEYGAFLKKHTQNNAPEKVKHKKEEKPVELKSHMKAKDFHKYLKQNPKVKIRGHGVND